MSQGKEWYDLIVNLVFDSFYASFIPSMLGVSSDHWISLYLGILRIEFCIEFKMDETWISISWLETCKALIYAS